MKNLISKIERNKIVRFISITAVVLGSLITIGTFINNINSYLYSNFFISKNISDKINNLSAGQSINFFKQELGVEKIQRKISDDYVEYIFQYKSAFVQAVSAINTNEVIYWAITDCGKDPVKISTLGEELFLNKSTTKDIFKEDEGEFHYFLSGATANSFTYESLYLGNPSGYQTIIVGENDICPMDMYDYLGEFDSTQEQINDYRKKGKINTYGETAPFEGEVIMKFLNAQHSDNNEPYITFGVDRIKIRIFNQ